MGRKSLTRDEYEKRGKKHHMTLIGDVPSRISMPTHWRCDICGRELYKSLVATQYHSPCICRTPLTLKPDDYSALASRLGITWCNEYPVSNKVKINWIGRDGQPFVASYSELAYDFIPSRLRGYIE